MQNISGQAEQYLPLCVRTEKKWNVKAEILVSPVLQLLWCNSKYGLSDKMDSCFPILRSLWLLSHIFGRAFKIYSVILPNCAKIDIFSITIPFISELMYEQNICQVIFILFALPLQWTEYSISVFLYQCLFEHCIIVSFSINLIWKWDCTQYSTLLTTVSSLLVLCSCI